MTWISTTIHGVLDNVLGLSMIFAPAAFGFEQHGGPADMLRLVGIATIALGLFTRYEFGLVKAIPMHTHLFLDMCGGLLLVASPWIFQQEFASSWMPHLFIGVLQIGVVSLSSPVPGESYRTGEPAATSWPA